MRTLHGHWAWMALVVTGGVGLWGLALAATGHEPDRRFTIGVGTAAAAMLTQVGLGFAVYQQGFRPGGEFHLFYGFLILFAFAFAYIFRAVIARRPAVVWGILLLFSMGLGIRAWVNVAG